MADAATINSKQVDLVKDSHGTYWSDEPPSFPEGLKLNPESYNIYLPKDKLHPVKEVAEEIMNGK